MNKIILGVMLAGMFIAPMSISYAQTPTVKSKAKATSSAPAWTIDARQSRLGFSTRWAGEAVNGTFRQWTGDIRFDPANLAASKAIITIQTASALTGAKEPDDNIGGGDWLDVRGKPLCRRWTPDNERGDLSFGTSFYAFNCW